MIVLVLMLVFIVLFLAWLTYKQDREFEKCFCNMRKEIYDLRQEKESLQSRLSRKGIKMPKREKK